MSRLVQLFSMFVLFFGVVLPAQADVITWKDQRSGASVSYPDTWRSINNQKPDDVLTIAAPIGQDSHEQAQCRLRVREDQRFAIYPARFDNAIQRLHVSRDFWVTYAGEFQDTRIDVIQDDAKLGRGAAGYAQMTFEPDNQKETGFRVTKRAIIYASQYQNNLYIFECSAQEVSFHEDPARWEAIFRNIASTVDFRPSSADRKTGEYRDFLSDTPIKIHGNRPTDHAYY